MKNIIKHVAFDVHADSNQVAIASPDGEVRDYGAIGAKLSDIVIETELALCHDFHYTVYTTLYK